MRSCGKFVRNFCSWLGRQDEMLPGYYAISWKDLLTGNFQEPMLADYLRRGDSCVFQVHELNAKCEHGRRIVYCYPTAGALEKDHDFVSLTSTVKAKLASIHVPTCKQECCSMRPLIFSPLQMPKDWSTRLHSFVWGSRVTLKLLQSWGSCTG